jgi:FixJ family two-component response regulator
MTIRFVAYRPGSLQLNALSQIAAALRSTLEATESLDYVRNAVSSDSPVCVFVCDQDAGMEAVQALEMLAEPNVLFYVFCPRPSIVAAVRAGLLGAKDVFDHTHSPMKIAEVVRSQVPSEEQNCLLRRSRNDFLQSLKQLSAAEHEVLRWILFGEPNKLIARRLKVSQRTIEARRHKVFKKMKVKSLAQLVRSIALYTDIDAILPSSENESGLDQNGLAFAEAGDSPRND